jgi:hypothetical protein
MSPRIRDSDAGTNVRVELFPPSRINELPVINPLEIPVPS